jgi:hypothetical protein
MKVLDQCDPQLVYVDLQRALVLVDTLPESHALF